MTLRRAIASARLLVRRACDIIRPAMDAMCDPEVCYSVTGFLLGMWILFGGAISSVNPSVRGLRLLSYAVQWLPWNVDYSWAAMLCIPPAFQLWHRWNDRALPRVKYAMLQAMVFSFIAALLFVDYPPSTGVVMYSMPAVVQVLIMRKIIIESHA